jgi:hypothetical protein
VAEREKRRPRRGRVTATRYLECDGVEISGGSGDASGSIRKEWKKATIKM